MFFKVYFLNYFLQKVWGQISLATEHLVISQYQSTLDSFKPIILTHLTIERVSLGDDDDDA